MKKSITKKVRIEVLNFGKTYRARILGKFGEQYAEVRGTPEETKKQIHERAALLLPQVQNALRNSL